MKFELREVKGVLKEFILGSVNFFKKKYLRRKAIDKLDNFRNLHNRIMGETKALFVLSTGRCGTDYLAHLLRQSKQLDVKHEATPVLAAATRYLYDNDLLYQEAGRASFLAARSYLLQDAFLFGKRYVETNNRLTFFAPAIQHLLPKTKFIHLVRHPGAFVRSGMRRGYYTNDNISDYGKIRPIKKDEVFDKWTSYSRIEKISWLWYRTNEIIEEFKDNYPDSVIEIKSEELFKDPDIVIHKIFDFTNDKFSTNIKTDLGPKNSQRSGEFPRYKDWTEKDKEKLRFIAGELAQQYEYEL